MRALRNTATEVLAPKPLVLAQRGAANAGLVPLVWGGGPIIAWPELISLYWGDFTPAQIDGMQSYLAGYAEYLQSRGAPAGQRCVVSQYDVKGASVGVSHVENVPPRNAAEADVQNLIEHLQQQGALPPFAPNRLFNVFTHGISFAGYGTTWCGYHGSWGDGRYFAIVPYPTAGGCGSGAPVASWQSITSHEINEAATDPGVGSGWITGSEEGGDTCAWQEFALGFGTVQLFEDDRRLSCSAWTPRVGQMWHTIRNADGTWQPSYGLVESQEQNDPGPFMDVGSAGVADALQLVGLSQTGQMWHTIRNADGTWQSSYGLIEDQEQNDPGAFMAVSCAGVGDMLHVVGLSQSGQMWHTVRSADGTWTPFYGLIEDQEQNDPGPFMAVGCAGVGDVLQVVGLSWSGQMWHTIRNADGTWQSSYGLIEGQEQNDPGPFMAVNCAGAGAMLQVVGLSQNGQMWHTLRNANGTWSPLYGLVESQEQNDPGPFMAVSCADVANALQLVGLSQQGQMWHTIRNANGTWEPAYGLVEAQEHNDPGFFITVSCAGVGSALQLVGLA
jgi:hypothetical protein